MFPSDWKLPNVYLLHGDLSSEEMNKLYNHPKVKSLVSLTHGEGFGRPLLEASMTGLPIVAPNWSGHVDFLNEKQCILLGGSLVTVPGSVVWEDIIIRESKWFKVDEHPTGKVLNYIFTEYDEVTKKSKLLMKENRNKFTLKMMSIKLDELMEKYIANQSTQVNLQLPKLKKVSSSQSETPKIKLPKLKKVKTEAQTI